MKQSEWNMKEKNLFQPIKEYFESMGYIVGAEIPSIGMSLCDVGAVKDNIAIAIELKMSLSEKVLWQCNHNGLCADAIYAAVPTTPRSLEKAKSLGVGVIQVKNDLCKIILDCKIRNRAIERYKKHFINETLKASEYRNIAGLPNLKGTGPRIECQKKVKEYITHVGYNPSWKELWECVENHYCSPSSMASALVK